MRSFSSTLFFFLLSGVFSSLMLLSPHSWGDDQQSLKQPLLSASPANKAFPTDENSSSDSRQVISQPAFTPPPDGELHPERVIDQRENLPPPLKIDFQKNAASPQISQPEWLSGKIEIDPQMGKILIPLPPLSEENDMESLVVTINFDDHGDGGPFLYWQKADGSQTLLAGGIGMNDGYELGLNSRSIELPYDLTLDGGSLILTHIGRFNQLRSCTIQPSRKVTISTLSTKQSLALLDENGNTYTSEEISAEQKEPAGGDYDDGHQITAELAAGVTEVNGGQSFSFSLTQIPDAALLKTSLCGVGMGSEVELYVNGKDVGTLNLEDADLNSPRWNKEGEKKELLGWRKASRYIPSSAWNQRENNEISLKLIHGPLDTPAPSSEESKENQEPGCSDKFYLKNSFLSITYPAENESSGHPASNPSSSEQKAESSSQQQKPTSSAEGNSTSSSQSLTMRSNATILNE